MTSDVSYHIISRLESCIQVPCGHFEQLFLCCLPDSRPHTHTHTHTHATH